MGEIVPQPWVVLGRRLHREQPALPCNRGCRPDSGEGGVRCVDQGRSCNSGTVGRAAPQEESAHHSAAMLCGFLKCCCTVESIASLSFQP